MPEKIDAKHPQYEARVDQWRRCRDAAAGGDQVKAAGVRYLPRLSGQDLTEYEAYKLRADWYGATSRTIAGLSGAVFRRDMEVEFPDSPEAVALLADLTQTNLSADQVAANLLDEVLEVGRAGAYVDYPPGEQEGGRPYVVRVNAEQIINWSTAYPGGRQQLVWLVLEESVEDTTADRFQPQSVTQWRLLELVDGFYEVSVWRKNERTGQEGQNAFLEVDRYYPTRRGDRLDFIPFVFDGPNDTTAMVDKPPLLDLVDINLSHYRSSADLEHGRHYVALPTAWVAGFPRDTELRIGSNVAWVSDQTDAKAGFLEFTGQGLGALETALSSKEQLMAVLGARLLEEQKKAAEAAATVQLRQAGEAATLTRIISTTEEMLGQLLRWVAWWANLTQDPADESIAVTLNRDLAAIAATPEQITALVAALQGGAMSFETVYANLERLEMTREGVDADEELAAIRDREDETLVLRPGATVEPAEQVRIARTAAEVAAAAAEVAA